MKTRLVVLAKSPEPGRVKTRLTPPLSPVQAAAVARAALQDTLRAVLLAGGRTPPLLALAGPPGTWLPGGFEVVRQQGDGLDERIAAALAAAGGPALLIGMDTPQVGPRMLRSAMRRLGSPGVDAVLGAATDGGWWALGLRVPDPGAVRGIPMSTARTGSAQRERLHRLGLRIRELPVLRDVDTFGDALAVAPTAPGGSFARELRGILEAGLPAAVLRCDDGHVVRLPVQRWTGEPSAEERLVLAWVEPPVLDIGCGPGRHVASRPGAGHRSGPLRGQPGP